MSKVSCFCHWVGDLVPPVAFFISCSSALNDLQRQMITFPKWTQRKRIILFCVRTAKEKLHQPLFYFSSFVVTRPAARQHSHTTRYHTHRKVTHSSLWILGKSTRSLFFRFSVSVKSHQMWLQPRTVKLSTVDSCIHISLHCCRKKISSSTWTTVLTSWVWLTSK